MLSGGGTLALRFRGEVKTYFFVRHVSCGPRECVSGMGSGKLMKKPTIAQFFLNGQPPRGQNPVQRTGFQDGLGMYFGWTTETLGCYLTPPGRPQDIAKKAFKQRL